jgi:hypothetical protein
MKLLREVEYGVEMEETLFVKTIKDKTLKEKAFILQCIDFNLLRRDGDYIVDTDDDTVYGQNLEQSVMYIKSEENLEKYNSLKRRFDSVKKEELV